MRLVAGVRPGYVVGDMYTTGPVDVLCSTHVTTGLRSRIDRAGRGPYAGARSRRPECTAGSADIHRREPVVVNGSGQAPSGWVTRSPVRARLSRETGSAWPGGYLLVGSQRLEHHRILRR